MVCSAVGDYFRKQMSTGLLVMINLLNSKVNILKGKKLLSSCPDIDAGAAAYYKRLFAGCINMRAQEKARLLKG